MTWKDPDGDLSMTRREVCRTRRTGTRSPGGELLFWSGRCVPVRGGGIWGSGAAGLHPPAATELATAALAAAGEFGYKTDPGDVQPCASVMDK